MHRILLLPLLIAGTLLSCSRHDNNPTGENIEKTEIAPRDKDIYDMGRRHAAYIINHYSHTDSLAYQLLEIRARETELATRVDRQAAYAYIAGFTAYVRSEAPELADSIF